MRVPIRLICVAAAAAGMAAAAPAQAGQATQTLPVSATVLNSCTVTAQPLVWTVNVPTNADIDITGSVAVRCPPNTAFLVEMDNGLHAAGNNRRVRNVTLNAHIRYGVFKNPARTQAWRTGAAGGLSGNSGATGTTVLPVYARLQSSNNLRAGGYTDTITVTITF